MFLIFSLRRPDVLPVGDLGVQKGLLKWALAAHDSLPLSKTKEGKKADACKAKYRKKEPTVKDEVDARGNGELDTMIRTPPPESRQEKLPPTPHTPSTEIKPAALHTPLATVSKQINVAPPTPVTPGQNTEVAAEVLEVAANELPPPAPEQLLASMPEATSWSADRAAPLSDGLSVELMRSRLAGKKAK